MYIMNDKNIIHTNIITCRVLFARGPVARLCFFLSVNIGLTKRCNPDVRVNPGVAFLPDNTCALLRRRAG